MQQYNFLHIRSYSLKKIKPKCTVIILDKSKGEVLAMASYPSYNPNHQKGKFKKQSIGRGL